MPGGYLIQVQFSRDARQLADLVERLPGVTEVTAGADGTLSVYADRGGPLVGPIVALAQQAGTEIHDVHISEPSLENLFLHHTGRSLRE